MFSLARLSTLSAQFGPRTPTLTADSIKNIWANPAPNKRKKGDNVILKELYVRYFNSFNYDLERKVEGTLREKWEENDPQWYPYVKIEIEPTITAIVGSNEAGKSQLLKAIKKAYGILKIEREDFCRYSSLL